MGAQHSFGGGAGAAPARSFGGGAASADGGGRHFGAAPAGGAPAGGEARHFGAATASEDHRFGAGAGEERHFGAATPDAHRFGGSEHAAEDRRFAGGHEGHDMAGHVGFRGEDGRPRRIEGHEFMYHGHGYARFAADRYRWPHGYAYHRWGVGYRLPRAFWISDYYIDDYALYDLEAPPYNYRWIRYGPDLLLINVVTGEIAQSVPGAFDEAG